MFRQIWAVMKELNMKKDELWLYINYQLDALIIIYS